MCSNLILTPFFMHTVALKVWGRLRFLNVFENSLFLHLFDQKFSKNNNIIQYYYNLKITMFHVIYFINILIILYIYYYISF